MERKKRQILPVFFLMLLLCGCSSQHMPMDAALPPRFAVQVDVICKNDPNGLSRQYTDSKKIESMLLYLRMLHPAGKPEADPSLIAGDIYSITVHLSDGTQHIYYQQSDRYLSKDLQPWERIEEKYGDNLKPLLQNMPSDANISGF